MCELQVVLSTAALFSLFKMLIFVQVTQSLELLKKRAFTYQNVHWIIQSFLSSLNIGTQYFIWQHYQLPNSPFIEVSFISITMPPIAVFSPLPLCISLLHLMPIPLNDFQAVSCLQSLLHITARRDFLLSTPRLKLQWFFKKQIIPQRS